MLTPASQQAIDNLRDLSMLEWTVIPLFAFVIYVYAVEVERQRWNIVFAGLAFWGMDWLNEIINSVILAVTGRSGLWTAPGDSQLIILSGLNIEIMLMFSIAGIALAKMLPKDKTVKILGLPNRLFLGIANSVFCVFVEVILNRADLLIWEYPFWNWPNIWLIIIFGYLHFNLVAFWVHDMPTVKRQAVTTGAIWGLAAAGVGVFGFGLGWL